MFAVDHDEVQSLAELLIRFKALEKLSLEVYPDILVFAKGFRKTFLSFFAEEWRLASPWQGLPPAGI